MTRSPYITRWCKHCVRALLLTLAECGVSAANAKRVLILDSLGKLLLRSQPPFPSLELPVGRDPLPAKQKDLSPFRMPGGPESELVTKTKNKLQHQTKTI